MENAINRSINSADVEEDEAFNCAMSATASFVLSMALNTAIELNLFDIISKTGEQAPVLPSDIAAQLPYSGSLEIVTRRIDCMLRLLANYSLLTCTVNKLPSGDIETRYRLAPAGKFFVRVENGASLASVCDFSRYAVGLLEACNSKLKDAVVGGGNPFERAYGMPKYEYMKSNSEYRQVFHDFMTSYSDMIMKRVCEKYNGFEGLSSIVNVGGGSGVTLDVIVSKYPSIYGINFDLQEVIESAPSYNGIHHIGGDMFEQVPQGDAILLKLILHNWTDDQCLQLLKNCYRSLPKIGKVIILDSILPDTPQGDIHSKIVSQSNYMMLMLFGSMERTKVEFEALAKKSGFSDFKVVCNAHCVWIMEFIKSE